MSRYTRIPCIVCDKELENVDFTADNQPYEGTAFSTHGHYGSTSFDPMNGSMLEINICDECLVVKGKANKVLWRREANALIHDGSIVGWIENSNTPYVHWIPGLDEVEDIDDDAHQQKGIIRIPLESKEELEELIETHGIRLNGGLKLNGGLTPEMIFDEDNDGQAD